jgi:hypothetical protein
MLTANVAPGFPTASARADIEPLLAKALVGPVALGEYLAALADSDSQRTTPPPTLDDETLNKLFANGLGVLSDEQLAAVASSPDAVRSLHTTVARAMLGFKAGDYWTDALDLPDESIPPDYLPPEAEGRVRAMLAALDGEPEGVAATSPATPRRLHPWVLALAASVLLALGLGVGWLLRSPNDTLQAKVDPMKKGAPRGGPEDRPPVFEVHNTGTRRLFVTLVGLSPDGQRRVFEKDQGKFIAVEPGTTTTVENFDAALRGATAYLVVVTETPAGALVTELLPANPPPADAGELRARLVEDLRGLGFRSPRVDVLTPP